MTVSNVRCFGEAQTLSFVGPKGGPGRWTIILGENGVGKTTLLQLLALAASGFPSYPRYAFESWDPDEGLAPPLQFARARERGISGSVKAMLVGAGPSMVHLTVGDERVDVKRASGESDILMCGYGAGRRIGASRLSRRGHFSRFRHASLFGDAPLRNAEEWLLGEDYAAAKEGRADGPAGRRLERLKELLTRILPEVDDVRVGEPTRHWSPSVEFKTPYGWVPLSGLSLGYQSLVAWMVDLAAAMFDRYEHHEDPLAEPAVVLVDEIDLHLHPKWQRDLMGFLSERFRRTQFIATAHSPLVVQAADGANVVLLKRDGNQVVIENHPTDVQNWRIDQILTSDLYGLPTARPPRLDKLIAARRDILTKTEGQRSRPVEPSDAGKENREMPAGESPEIQDAMALILRASKTLKSRTPEKKR